jgi:uncharacterized protein YcbK (DUF882 family)
MLETIRTKGESIIISASTPSGDDVLSRIISRRRLLKTAVAGAFGLCARQAHPHEPRTAEGLPEGRLSLLNIHTAEKLEVAYRDTKGRYDPEALDAMDRLLRCHYTHEVARIDIRVIEYLNSVDKLLGGEKRIHVVSGFRSRAYNDLLIREGRRVAPRSLHLAGMAVDFRIPGVGLKTVMQTALDLKSGGVGYYPASGFVHIDCGRIRSW